MEPARQMGSLGKHDSYTNQQIWAHDCLRLMRETDFLNYLDSLMENSRGLTISMRMDRST